MSILALKKDFSDVSELSAGGSEVIA